MVQNGNSNGHAADRQEHEPDNGLEKFSSPLRGYFSLPPQDLEGASSSSHTDTSSALPSSPFDREHGVGVGGEGREERGRGSGRGREGATGRGKARERSIDSAVSFTSESSYVTSIEKSRQSKKSQSVRSEAEAALGLNYQSNPLSFGGRLGRLMYDSDRKWGSWLGL